MPPSPSSLPDSESEHPVLRVRGLSTQVGGEVLVENIDLDLRPGEVLGVVGASGAGKSILLRTLVGLIPPAVGTIEAFGQDLSTLDPAGLRLIEARWGVLFQDGALFSSLTVAENVAVPLHEMADLPPHLIDEIVTLKIALVGLPADAAQKFPSELSGGMRKRAGLARALAVDPALIFLDEPTSGLDPIAAAEFDKLIGDLRRSLGLTVFMVTHDLDSLFALADRVAVLVRHGLKIGSLDDMLHDNDPWITRYFGGARGHGAKEHAPQPEAAGG